VIYLCIPAHNEEQTVGVVLWKIRQVMAELQRDYQLLVADDASSDRTLEVLEPYMRVLPLTVFRNAERRGYAASLEMLVREAVKRSDYPRRDVVITLQADFTDEPGHVATLLKRLESGADIVASNALPARNAPRLVRWWRPVLNRLVRRLGWPEEVHDPLNGFNAFRVQTVKRAIEERKGGRLLRAEGWAANAQLLHEAAPHARRVDAVELQAHPERLQRASRFLFMPAFNQVLGLRRGRDSDALLAVDALAPASVLGGPSSQRSLVAESLREEAAAAAPDRVQRRGRADGQQRAERAGTRRGAGRETQRGEPRKRAPVEGGRSEGRRQAASAKSDAQVIALPGQEGPAAVGAEAVPDAPAPRSRRGRRGGAGRKRRTGTEGDAARPDARAAADATDGTAEAAVNLVATDESERGVAPADAAAAPDGAAPRKRRRGGRGRRKRGGGSEPNGAASSADSAAATPSDQAPPIETQAPRAS
jgi:hypothetical protein